MPQRLSFHAKALPLTSARLVVLLLLHTSAALALVATGALLCCTEKPLPPLKSLAPAPLQPLRSPAPALLADGRLDEREALHRIEPAPVFGEEVPLRAARLKVEGTGARWGEELIEVEKPEGAARLRTALAENAAVLLQPVADVYLAQAAALLAVLDDMGAEVYLGHVGGVAFPIDLRDEPGFQAWLDEPKPGKVRVVQRADGFELQTNVGKLPGSDPNGPTVPLRGGQLDIATLRRGMGRLKERFKSTPDACFVPSFGTELASVAAAMSGDYRQMGEPFFEEICLVYPRPRQSEAPAGR